MLRALAATLVLAAPAPPGPPSPGPASPGPPSNDERAQSAITEAALRADVAFLASDLLEGRGPGTRGGRVAEAYLAAQLQGMGFEGAAPGGGYLQKVPLVGIEARAPSRVRFAAGGKRLDLA